MLITALFQPGAPPYGKDLWQYKRLLEAFAKHGVRCLTYGKERGHKYTVASRIQEISDQLDVTQASVLIGHSEGAMLVGQFADDPRLKAVVSLCAPYGRLWDHWVYRFRDDPDNLAYYRQLERWFIEESWPSHAKFVDFAEKFTAFTGWQSLGWMRDHWLRDNFWVPGDVPKLIVQGLADDRVLPENLAKWQAWVEQNSSAKLMTFGGGHSFGPEHVGAVATWLKKQF